MIFPVTLGAPADSTDARLGSRTNRPAGARRGQPVNGWWSGVQVVAGGGRVPVIR